MPDEYVIVEKSTLDSIGDTVRSATGSTGNISVNNLNDAVAAAITSGGVLIDSSLTQSGYAADAKATGDAIRSLSDDKANQADVDELKKDLADLEYNVSSDFGYDVIGHPKYESNQLPNPDGTFFTDKSSIQQWFGSGYVEIPFGVLSIKFCGINYNSTTITPIAFYDSDKNFISCYPNETVFKPVEGVIEIPQNAKYYYQSKYYSEGDARNSDNYTIYSFGENYDMESIKESFELLGYGSVEYGEDAFVDTNICMVGGTFKKFSGWYSSDYIKCNGRNYLDYDSYAFSNGKLDVAYISFFDKNKTYISGLKSSDTTHGEKIGKIAIPSNAYYVRGLKAGGNNPFIKFYATGLISDKDIYDKNLPLTNDMTIYCIGDSLTEGIDVGSHKIKESYPYFMGKYLNCNILNYGQKGRSSKTWWDNYKDYYSFTPDIDVVLIMFGTNGGNNINTLSTDVEPYDSWENYADTGVGCYCKLIEYIYEQTNNHAQIILLTPPYSTYTEAQENLVKETNPVIKAIAERYSIPVIDVFNECGMGKFNASVFRPHDGCHFNAKGYHKLGTYIGSKVKSLISTFDLTDVYDDETVG